MGQELKPETRFDLPGVAYQSLHVFLLVGFLFWAGYLAVRLLASATLGEEAPNTKLPARIIVPLGGLFVTAWVLEQLIHYRF